MAEPFTIYKITILFMLDRANFPLSNTQISNFFLDRDYTDYFRVQEVIGDLLDSDLILSEGTHSNTQYTLTDSGRKTLEFFKDKLNDEIKEDVNKFLQENQVELRQENFLLANYYRTTGSKYAVRCQARSDNETLVDLTLLVKNREQAKTICTNWKEQNEEVYACLMDILLK